MGMRRWPGRHRGSGRSECEERKAGGGSAEEEMMHAMDSMLSGHAEEERRQREAVHGMRVKERREALVARQ